MGNGVCNQNRTLRPYFLTGDHDFLTSLSPCLCFGMDRISKLMKFMFKSVDQCADQEYSSLINLVSRGHRQHGCRLFWRWPRLDLSQKIKELGVTLSNAKRFKNHIPKFLPPDFLIIQRLKINLIQNHVSNFFNIH